MAIQVGVKDCAAVSRLKKRGGAIVLGVANTSEACMWYEAANKINGRSNNPFDTTRTPGGSSGGNAALVGALCGPFAVTSDVDPSSRKVSHSDNLNFQDRPPQKL